jgi:hypothetical protein
MEWMLADVDLSQASLWNQYWVVEYLYETYQQASCKLQFAENEFCLMAFEGFLCFIWLSLNLNDLVPMMISISTETFLNSEYECE